jgi:hypothetical protein
VLKEVPPNLQREREEMRALREDMQPERAPVPPVAKEG